jgi:hypothetical protein
MAGRSETAVTDASTLVTPRSCENSRRLCCHPSLAHSLIDFVSFRPPVTADQVLAEEEAAAAEAAAAAAAPPAALVRYDSIFASIFFLHEARNQSGQVASPMRRVPSSYNVSPDAVNTSVIPSWGILLLSNVQPLPSAWLVLLLTFTRKLELHRRFGGRHYLRLQLAPRLLVCPQIAISGR